MQFKLTKKTRTHKRCFEIMTKSCRLLPDVAVSSYRSSTRSTQNFHTISLFFESKKGWMWRWQPKFATSIVYLQINMHPETFWILIPVSSNFATSGCINSFPVNYDDLPGDIGVTPKQTRRRRPPAFKLFQKTSSTKVLLELFRNRLRIVKNNGDRF